MHFENIFNLKKNSNSLERPYLQSCKILKNMEIVLLTESNSY